MRSLILVLPFTAMTFLCWGSYGPVLHVGQHHMGQPPQVSSLRPFVCVGLAYFLIAVVVPSIVLKTRGETGKWTVSGTIWSFLAGTAGAFGALGIISAFKSRGSPVYVMPLIFGCAPVVNTFFTMWMTKTFGLASRIFFVGVVCVAIGAAGVLYFKPASKYVTVRRSDDGMITVIRTDNIRGKVETWEASSPDQLKEKDETAYMLYLRKRPLENKERLFIVASIGLTALCWGCYGSVLHRGQMEMGGSRMRPFLCVGLAYFAVAVVVPLLLMTSIQEPGAWTFQGTIWSLAAGSAGAMGALGIILSFNFGGKPIYVMPIVFGGAPVINTVITIVSEGTYENVTFMFFASLCLVVTGAVTVLVFAPRPRKMKQDDGN